MSELASLAHSLHAFEYNVVHQFILKHQADKCQAKFKFTGYIMCMYMHVYVEHVHILADVHKGSQRLE